MTQACSTCNYNVMGKVDCMRSREVTQSRFLVIFFDKFKIKMLKRGAKQLEKTISASPQQDRKTSLIMASVCVIFNFQLAVKLRIINQIS